MKIAQILNNKVHWIFKSETMPEWPPDQDGNYIILIDITNMPEVQEGWNYDPKTGIFTGPKILPEVDKLSTMTLDEAQRLLQVKSLGVEIPLELEIQAQNILINGLPLPEPEKEGEWVPGERVIVGVTRVYNGISYECVESHITQLGWEPPTTPALWEGVHYEWEEWSQPLGAHDTYHKGDKVIHGGIKWVSNVDNNSWEPGVYGWNISNN